VRRSAGWKFGFTTPDHPDRTRIPPQKSAMQMIPNFRKRFVKPIYKKFPVAFNNFSAEKSASSRKMWFMR